MHTCCISQQTKEKVKLLIQLADNFVEKGHVHVTELKKWVSMVDRRYRDFSQRMGQYRCSLENALGISSEVRKHLLKGLTRFKAPRQSTEHFQYFSSHTKEMKRLSPLTGLKPLLQKHTYLRACDGLEEENLINYHVSCLCCDSNDATVADSGVFMTLTTISIPKAVNCAIGIHVVLRQ